MLDARRERRVPALAPARGRALSAQPVLVVAPAVPVVALLSDVPPAVRTVPALRVAL